MSKASGEVTLVAQGRSDFGKGAARRLRREGRIPAVVYGQGKDLTHISLPAHDLELALRDPRVVLTISIDGGSVLTRPQEVQRDPVRRSLEHVDLIIIDSAEAAARIKASAEAAQEIPQA